MALLKTRRRLNPLAIELGLAAPISVVDDGENASGHYYDHMLDLCERLFEQEIDQGTFEEHLRYMWGVEAYPMFTVDKVMSAVIKHIHSINGDSTSQYLLKMGKQDRAKGEIMTVREQIAYRMQAEAMIGPPPDISSNSHNNMLYRIEWKPDTMTLSVQVMRTQDSTMEKPQDPKKAWEQYLESYVLRTNTESIGADDEKNAGGGGGDSGSRKEGNVRTPFLHRNYRLAEDEDYEHVVEKTDVRIEMRRNYGMVFGEGTGFLMVRDRTKNENERERAARERERRKEQWTAWSSSNVNEEKKPNEDE